MQVTDRYQAPGALRIDATYVYLAEVDHGPAELLSLGVGDDLVGHEIVVSVYLEVQGVEPRLLRCELVLQPYVVLGGVLWVELDVAYFGVV